MSFMSFLILLGVAFGLLGFLDGRWSVLVPAAVAVPLYVLGRAEDWWGHGVGDGWEIAAVAMTLVATTASCRRCWSAAC
jgi:hypothetical protein